MNKIYFLILGMMIVTYLPRLIPFYLFSNRELSSRIKIILENIPYAALGALVIPGCINAIPENKLVSIIGIVISILFAYFKEGVIIPVLGSIFACIILLNLGL